MPWDNPAWRFKEIVNLADSIVFLASYCPIGRLVPIAAAKYLKPNSHIRLHIDPAMPKNTARCKVEVARKELCQGNSRSAVTFHTVTIYFNGDIATHRHWNALTRALLRALGYAIFFSPGANRRLITKDEDKFLNRFVDRMMRKQPFAMRTVRPRFYLARLQVLVEKEMPDSAGAILPYLQRFLWPYLGPDGLMDYR